MEISEELESILTGSLGFRRTDFVSYDGRPAVPRHHLTVKLTSGSEFRRVFAASASYAERTSGMVGYIEGEVIASDQEVPVRTYCGGACPPYRLERRPLRPGTFRESEVHITLCPERSDKRLLRDLQGVGLASVYMPKSWGIAVIFTAQGARDAVRQITEDLTRHLLTAGGAYNCSVKEEVVARWWVSDANVCLPDVVTIVPLCGDANKEVTCDR